MHLDMHISGMFYKYFYQPRWTNSAMILHPNVCFVLSCTENIMAKCMDAFESNALFHTTLCAHLQSGILLDGKKTVNFMKISTLCKLIDVQQ